MEDFTELKVWQESRKFRNNIRELVRTFPDSEKFMLISQIIRSSRSVTANIAEGYGRYHYQECIQFLRIGRGSLKETRDHLTVALDENYIDQNTYKTLLEQYFSCNRLINAYINYLKTQKKK